MTRPLVFEVGLPPGALSPNVRMHGAPRGARGAEYREECRLECLSAFNKRAQRKDRWPFPRRVRVTLAFQTANRLGANGRRVRDLRYRPLDLDNAQAAAKPLFDGLVLAGLVRDDRAEFMQHGTLTIDAELGPGVIVTVEEADE